MSCTQEEIAEKRRIAIERLNARKNACYFQPPQPKPATSFQSKPTPQTAVHSSKSFYSGNTPNTNKLNGLENKFKTSFNNSRLNSQPYSKDSQKQSQGKFDNNNYSKSNIAPVFFKTISCTCSMLTENRFVVIPSGFHEKLVENFKSIPSKAYDSFKKNWNFHIDDYNLVQERIGAMKPDIVIGAIPNYVLKLCKEPKMETNSVCLSAIDPRLVSQLMPFQKEGVCFGIDRQGRVLIADEMGLGKTYQALAIADFYKNDWPLLICTTATIRDVWATKIRELLPYVPVHNIVVVHSATDYIGDAKILISSYNLMEKCYEKFQERKFGVVIMDESHTLKNFKSKCTAVALEISKAAKRIILLSGTPALSRPVELFTQLQMLDRKYFNFKEYSARYCAGKQTNFGWDASGQSNLPELNILLLRKFMIRRTKQDVLSQLAEKNRETVILDPALIWNNDDVEENLSSYAKDYMSSKGREKEEILLLYYNMTAEAKVKAVCHYVKKLLKEHQKFIIFAHHVIMMDAISNSLSRKNIKFIRIDGTTKSKLRSQHVDTFQNKEECRVAVLSMKACNAGITLTAAQLVVFAELDWNPSTLAQAEGRAHRIGQEGTVHVKYLIAKGTADDVIWTMLQKKQDVLNKAGLSNEDFSEVSNSNAPCSAGNIEPFLEKTTGGPFEKYLKKTPASSSIVPTTSNTTAPDKSVKASTTISNVSEDFRNLLDDGDDDDLVGLDF